MRAAGAMLARLAELNDELDRRFGVRLSMRIGVNTGEVVHGGEGFVVGDPVNVAARLEQSASDGEVLVGEPTWRLVREAVTLEPVEALSVKGKDEPLRVFRLVSTGPPAPARTAPFVGRDAELAELRAALDDAVASRRARIVTVLGSPGVGKTRLVDEFVRTAGFARAAGRCDPAGSSTFAPLAEAIRAAAALGETEDAAQRLAQIVGDEPDRDRIVARVASVLGAGEPGSPEETFWAVRRVFEALARERPLIVTLDDVHWAQPMLLDLVEHIAEWSRGAPILLVVSGRPELREIRPSLADAVRHPVVAIDGLDATASERLAHELLGAHDLPDHLVARLLASSEGNPLFLRELLRMFVDDGVLRRDGDRWVVRMDAADVDVPPTIHALLSARLEQLGAGERSVVERAAVVGKRFYRGAVAELVPGSVGPRLDAHLETLRRKQLVDPEGTYWIDEPVFRFHHALIRDAAYRRLLKEARADLHERFADWLQRKTGAYAGEHDEVLGYHLEQAFGYHRQLGPPSAHAAELGRRAARHLASAGRRALEREDLALATDLLGRAVALTDLPDADLLIDRCEALLAAGAAEAARGAVEDLERCSRGSEREQAWVSCYRAQLETLSGSGRLREAAAAAAAAADRCADG